MGGWGRKPAFLWFYLHPIPKVVVVVVVEAMQYSKANKAKEDAPQMIMKL